jgi:hypothetical protein
MKPWRSGTGGVLDFTAVPNTWEKLFKGERLILAQFQRFQSMTSWFPCFRPEMGQRVTVVGACGRGWLFMAARKQSERERGERARQEGAGDRYIFHLFTAHSQ